ncbi:xylulose 5-phosphate 3-epimerase, partial [Azotobacter chroococcum]|nr:xylulose 5-phosphate 3-epimerase [Azotobacter chroococcum]
LKAAGQAYRLLYLQEPGRFRASRDRWEAAALADGELIARLFPDSHGRRVLLSHMRPEVARGHLWPILPDARRTLALGYRNAGGTLDEAGMLFANRASWAHVLEACATLLEVPVTALLSRKEADILAGHGDPAQLRAFRQGN